MGLEKIRKDWFMSKPSQSTTEVTTAKKHSPTYFWFATNEEERTIPYS